jgi:hypothetical protein
LIFHGKPLREVTEADVRALVDAGLAEHVHLEYKRELYPGTEDGNKEFLLDVCMFANSQGGVLLVGVPEARDGNGQPTGIPDPGAQLGIRIQNPEATLLAYGARMGECIEESLQVESHAIPVAPDRFVLAFRIPQSAARPHSVRYRGHIYFPCRRERHRDYLDVTEIKEMTIRVASQTEKADTLLSETLTELPRPQNVATLSIGLVPVYFREFGTDIGDQTVRQAFARFHVRAREAANANTNYAYQGLIRQTRADTAALSRSGLVRVRLDIPTVQNLDAGAQTFYVSAIDVFYRNFILRAREFFATLNVAGPFLLRGALLAPARLFALDQWGQAEQAIEPARYDFPTVQVMNLSAPLDQTIKPFCDQAHQMFGEPLSPCFDAEGRWQVQF